VNRLASSSPPLLCFVLFGSATIFIRGTFDAWGYWRRRRATADWFFPALVLVLFVVVPNLLNGVETQRIRYSVEPLLFIALFAGVLGFKRRGR
jgi:drug/metabolite transporter superfamily protein YnfA